MQIKGTVELLSWVLSFGDHAKVLEPESLRKEIADELKRAAAQYEKMV